MAKPATPAPNVSTTPAPSCPGTSGAGTSTVPSSTFRSSEQTPLAWYYLPNGLHYATPLGRVKDPAYMNWVFALRRLEQSNPQAVLTPLLASLRPGQQLLFIRPLTEGAKNWKAAWTALVRRRSAQLPMDF